MRWRLEFYETPAIEHAIKGSTSATIHVRLFVWRGDWLVAGVAAFSRDEWEQIRARLGPDFEIVNVIPSQTPAPAATN